MFVNSKRTERIETLNKQEFLELVEAKRIELNKIVAKNGLNSKITIEYSQKLDRLLNQYYTFNK